MRASETDLWGQYLTQELLGLTDSPQLVRLLKEKLCDMAVRGTVV